MRRIALLLLLMLACGAGVLAALPASDSFTGTDTGLSGSWGTPLVGSFAITSNKAAGQNGSGYSMVPWTADTFTADQYAQVVAGFTTATYAAGVCVRGQIGSSGSGYCFYGYEGDSTGYLDRIDSAVHTTLATCGTVTSGSTFRLSVSGTTLTGSVNGTVVCTATDATYSTGPPMIFAYLGGNVDDFTADNVGGGGGGGGSPSGGLLLLGVGAALWHGFWPFDGAVPGRWGLVGQEFAPQPLDINHSQRDQHSQDWQRQQRERQQQVLQHTVHLRPFPTERSDLSRAGL